MICYGESPKDMPVLTVISPDKKYPFKVTKEFIGDEAINVFKKLTGNEEGYKNEKR